MIPMTFTDELTICFDLICGLGKNKFIFVMKEHYYLNFLSHIMYACMNMHIIKFEASM